jgi:hypothetical protein
LFLAGGSQGFRRECFAGFGEGIYGPLAGAAELEAFDQGGGGEGFVNEVG